MDKGLIIHCILLNEANKILILKRNKNEDVLPSYWDIPGGTLKDGEDPIVGTIRETKEESGIEINNPNLLFHTSNIDRKKNKQFIRLIFIAKCTNDQVKLNPDEHEEYRWITLDEIKKYKTVDYLPECSEMIKNKQHVLFHL